MKKIFLGAGVFTVFFLAILLIRTFRFEPPREPKEPYRAVAIEVSQVALKLSKAIQLPTISHVESKQNELLQWQKLRELLEKSFPKIHQLLKREVVGGHSLLYEWTGKDPQLPPILFLAHQDVVPIAPGTEKDWAHPPFSGAIAEGYIWGRGAIDDKGGMIALLEAIESLLQNRFEPKRTILIALGHDEEVGGVEGAKAIAALLKDRQIKAEMILDEGGVITEGVMTEISSPLALIGVAEKGYVTIEMLAKAAGGHSSMPPERTAIGVLSRAIQRLEANPLPARLESPTREMLLTIGPKMGFTKRLAIANLDWFQSLLIRELEKTPSTNASIRTTIAPTVFIAGEKENVLPVEAKALVNFRVLPGESSTSVMNYVRQTIQDDTIELKATVHGEPSPVSSTTSQSYEQLKRAIVRSFEGAVVAPYLTLGGTDTKHYTTISDNIFRFLPNRLGPNDLNRFHGTNERISVTSLGEMVRFYMEVIQLTTYGDSLQRSN